MALPQRGAELPTAPSEPTAHLPEGRPRPLSDRAVLAGLALLTFALRALAFPFTENLYGDAVARTELAERWLSAPHLITSFNDGVRQFGPLHTYVLAGSLALWHDRAVAGRLASLIFGVLAVVPTYRLTDRLFGRRAAVWAGLGFALWGMHIQMSTTAGSESLALCLFAVAVEALYRGLEEHRFAPMAMAAIFLNLACAVRYDVWMYIPLFTLAVALWGQDRIAAVTRSIMFAGLAVIFPLLWMQGNEKAMGDALYPIHFIDQFHRQWTQDGVAWLGAPLMRLWGLGFWPGTLLLTLSPLLGLCALVGAGRCLRLPEKRVLVYLALVPTLYFTFRAAVLLDFSPLARFAAIQVWLCLPFSLTGFTWLTARASPSVRTALVVLIALVAVATPAGIAAASFHVDGGLGQTLKPVSPVTTLPQDQMEVAHWLRDNIAGPDKLLIDYDDRYTDIGVAFFSSIPEDRLLRLRWETEEHERFTRRVEAGKPRAVLLLKSGKLLAQPGVQRAGEVLTAYGLTFHKRRSFSGDRYEVYTAE
jgi:4-amino-4-deoxy-L-arabinose transferase-like glycosyltransferase